VPKKIIGTLILNISNSIHILISLIIICKRYSITTSGYFKLLLLENYNRVIVFTTNFAKSFFDSIIVFLYYSSTIELILSFDIYIEVFIRVLSLVLI
jgi:hypothetical protein